MQKKLTALFVFAFFVLLVVWAITPAQAHTKFCVDKPDHHHCPNGEPPPDGGGEPAEYSVNLRGAVTGVTTQPWQKSSKNGIGYSDPHALLASDSNLSYFFLADDGSADNKITLANRCFDGITPILFGNIRKRRGMAEANFWIEGKTQIENDNRTVIYELELLGLFRDPDNWLTFGDTIDVSGWEWKVANGQSDLENFSCRGVGDFPANMQFIDVLPQ